MSPEIVAQILERASTDTTFWAQLVGDPASALADYELTVAERAAVLGSDVSRLQPLGVDARVTKSIDMPTLLTDETPPIP